MSNFIGEGDGQVSGAVSGMFGRASWYGLRIGGFWQLTQPRQSIVSSSLRGKKLALLPMSVSGARQRFLPFGDLASKNPLLTSTAQLADIFWSSPPSRLFRCGLQTTEACGDGDLSDVAFPSFSWAKFSLVNLANKNPIISRS